MNFPSLGSRPIISIYLGGANPVSIYVLFAKQYFLYKFFIELEVLADWVAKAAGFFCLRRTDLYRNSAGVVLKINV